MSADFQKVMDQTLLAYLNAVKGRAAGGVTNTPFMSDEDWKKALEIVHKKGPLSDAEKVVFKLEHDHFARAHFLDLVFELEHAYTAIEMLRRAKR